MSWCCDVAPKKHEDCTRHCELSGQQGWKNIWSFLCWVFWTRHWDQLCMVSFRMRHWMRFGIFKMVTRVKITYENSYVEAFHAYHIWYRVLVNQYRTQIIWCHNLVFVSQHGHQHRIHTEDGLNCDIPEWSYVSSFYWPKQPFLLCRK